VNNLITPRALFSPVFLQRRSVIHENGSDNSFQRYGHSKFSKMAGGRILDLVQPEVGPFDPPSPKTPPYGYPRVGFSGTADQKLESLRSANRDLLLIPPHTTNFSRRALSFAAPTVWNRVPTDIRDSNTLHTFKHRLKHSSHLFPVNQRPTPSPARPATARASDSTFYSTLCAL